MRAGPVRPAAGALSAALLSMLCLGEAVAQVTLDGSLGPRGSLTGADVRIGPELGQSRGPNLFHSFGAFNVQPGQRVTFTGPATIAHIVGRVTGGTPSIIEGVLRSEIAGANLFLLNPAGVLFGPGASLDVSGSFHVSTAPGLRLADGTVFSADLARAGALSVAPPAAFGFLDAMPAAISIDRARLQVAPGKTLALVGGDVRLAGPATGDVPASLEAPGGRVALAAVTGPGEVPVDVAATGIPAGGAGAIELTRGAVVDVSGDGGGSVVVRGGRLLVDDSGILADTRLAGDGAPLAVDVRVSREVALTAGGLIAARTFGAGRAGAVSLEAGHVALEGTSRISSTTSGPGRGGDVQIRAGRLVMRTGAVIQTGTVRAGGDAGQIAVTAEHVTLDAAGMTAETRSAGRGGGITFTVDTLTLTGGTQIRSPTFGLDFGQGGAITVAARDAVVIQGEDGAGNPSGLFTIVGSPVSNGPTGNGNAGDIRVSTPRLTLDGGEISARTEGLGRAGGIAIEVERLTLTGGGRISSSTLASGAGGTVTVTASGPISISGPGSGLSTRSTGQGAAGDITVTARTLELLDVDSGISVSSSRSGLTGDIRLFVADVLRMERSTVNAEAGEADGGNVAVAAGALVHLVKGSISATVRGGRGTGGNVAIDAAATVLDRSRITADAFGGPGGNVRIGPPEALFLQSESILSASSAQDVEGVVTVEAPTPDIAGRIARLAATPVETAHLLAASCATRFTRSRFSTLVVAGRPGIPPEPAAFQLSSPLLDDAAAVAPRPGGPVRPGPFALTSRCRE